MSLISALIIIAGRFIVKIFITVFGWAMVIFFGRIPEEKNKKLAVIALLSISWIILIIGISYPAITKAFYDYIPDKNLKHIVSVLLETVGIILIPVVVGEISVFMSDEKKQASDFIKATLKGYYYSFVMGISMILMLIMAPFITLKRFILRQENVSLTVMIPDGRVRDVMRKLKYGLNEKGYQVLMRKPELMMSMPVILIRWMLKELLDADITQNLTLQGEGFRVYLNATDILVVGKKKLIDTIKIQVAKILMYDACYMTWSTKSHSLEQELFFIFTSFYNEEMNFKSSIEKLEILKSKVDQEDLEYQEWDVISKKIAVFETEILKKGNANLKNTKKG